MRNLKKILALVLALVMSLSLMATAGAGSFQDVTDDNPYKTAIDVLDELKVFQGFEDGTFKPTDTLTRAQAAVLVYRIATGDVDNKYLDNYTYMQQSKFTDLDGYNWAKGYINYCQNAGIVVGTDATHFNPGGQVTGYQLLVMLLRTLGYGKAGEFTDPKGWELQTASIAEREGILKNVTGGDFEHAAPRQMVAEILFRGILHDTVEYSPLTPGGYTNSGVSLGKKTLNLDDIEGVVVANRIADLYDTEPMKDGQTRMIVDGKDYVIDMDTDATAIGLNHHAYVQNGKVLGGSLEADGNVIGEPEHGEASEVAKLAKAAGIKTDKDTEYYVNFDQNITGYSEWRLEYTVKFETLRDKTDFEANIGLDMDVDVFNRVNRLDKVGTTTDGDGTWNNEYTRSIPYGNQITPEDVTVMKGIFTYASGDTGADFDVAGAVYAGTNNKDDANEPNRNKDLAATMTWNAFYNEYILGSKTEVLDSDNGEWLRVIDNNGDGVAEYVLRTDFVMTTVTDYEKRTDTYVVEWEGDLPNGNGKGTIKADAIRPVNDGEAADMSIGSVILYTLIDGYYYISNPVAQSMTIDKKSIDSKKGTFTVDGEGYTWSEIEAAAARYYDSLSDLAYETKYDMYPDHFGFIRLATETSRNFVLLTDGWFYTDNRNPEYKADLYDGETFVENVEVVDKARDDAHWNDDGFIDTYEDDHKGNRGTWLRLNTFGEYYSRQDGAPTTYWDHYIDPTGGEFDWTDPAGGKAYYTRTAGVDTYHGYKDPFVTNIALGSESDGKWTLEDVTLLDIEFNGLYRDYNTYELAGTNNAYYDLVKQRTVKAKTTDLWGVTAWTDDAHEVDDTTAIQANGSTLYYLVQNPGAKDQSVISWVGYQNVPESVGNFVAERAYAVTRDVRTADVDYEIAEVVVFEGIYSKPVKDPQMIIRGNTSRNEYSLGKDEDGEYTEHFTTYGLFKNTPLKALDEEYTDGLRAPQVRFYDPAEEKYVDTLGAKYADYGIYAGTAKVLTDTKGNDYIQMIWDDTLQQTSKRFTFYIDNVAAYELNQLTSQNGWANKNLEVNETYNIRQDDLLIIVVDGDDNVKMVVDVSGSGKDGKTLRRDGPDNAITKLVQQWNDIVTEQTDIVLDSAAKLLARAKEILRDPNATAEEIDALGTQIADYIDPDNEANRNDADTMEQIRELEDILTDLTAKFAEATYKEAKKAALDEVNTFANNAKVLAGDSQEDIDAIEEARQKAIKAINAIDQAGFEADKTAFDTAVAAAKEAILDIVDALPAPEEPDENVSAENGDVTMASNPAEPNGTIPVTVDIDPEAKVTNGKIVSDILVKKGYTPTWTSEDADGKITSVTFGNQQTLALKPTAEADVWTMTITFSNEIAVAGKAGEGLEELALVKLVPETPTEYVAVTVTGATSETDQVVKGSPLSELAITLPQNKAFDSATVKVGEGAAKAAEYNAETGKLTFAEITATAAITVEVTTKDVFNVTLAGAGANNVTCATTTAVEGSKLNSLTIAPKAGFVVKTVSVKVGSGEAKTATAGENNAWTFDEQTITADVTVTVTTAVVYTVTVTTGFTVTPTTIEADASSAECTFTVAPAENNGGELPTTGTNVKATVKGADQTVTYEKGDGTATVKFTAAIDGDVVITIAAD